MARSPVLVLLLGLSACTSDRGDDRGAGRERGSLASVVIEPFQYVGVGGMGRVTDYDRHPSLPDVLVAGTDVGGVFLSADGGASWTNVTRDMASVGAWAVRFVVEPAAGAETTRVVVGGDSGLYVSADMDSADGLGADELTGWSVVEGLEAGEELPNQSQIARLGPFNGSQHALTVFTLAVSPSDPSMVWAGAAANAQVNLAQNAKDPASLQRFDRWKVFRSTDGGLSFEPALRFSAPITDFVATPYDSAGSVFSILVHPEDPALVWVAGDRGLYRSENADSTDDLDEDGVADLAWEELGVADGARRSANAGQRWAATTAGCADHEDDPTAGAWCLPVRDTAKVRFVLDPETGWPAPGYEEHPNLRALTLSTVDGVETLFATVWDRGHVDDAAPGCSDLVDGDSFVDADLQYYRGGVYASTDGGERWTWLLSSNGAPGSDPDAVPLLEDRRYRCDAATSERNSDYKISFMSDVEAPPDDSEGFLLVASGLGAGAGLYVYDPEAAEPWRWMTDSSEADWADRFEGGEALAISGPAGVEPSRLLVDWERRAEGYPELIYGQRGALEGAWDSADGRYEFENLSSDYLGVDADGMSVWTGTGLDDCVAWQAVDTGEHIYVGVSDGGLLRAEDAGDRLEFVNLSSDHWTPNWSSDPSMIRKDEVRAVAFDAESGRLYAGAFVSAVGNGHTIYAGAGTEWSIIGGSGYTTDPALARSTDPADLNGLYAGSPRAVMEFTRLVAIPKSLGWDTDLLAASSDGLWAWDEEATAGAQWTRVCEVETNNDEIADLAFDPTLIDGWAFAMDESHRVGGLYAIRLSDLACDPIEVRAFYDVGGGSLLTGKDPIRYGTGVGLAADGDTGEPRLLAGATYGGYPSLFSAVIECDESACAFDAWDYAWTADGYYTAGERLDSALKRDDVLDMATDPFQPNVVVVTVGTTPGSDHYNPEIMLWSEDGGQSFVDVDLTDTAYNLPNRGIRRLDFSADGAWLYASSPSSLYRMPVSW